MDPFYIIKNVLTQNLEKQGSSIFELEESLAKVDVENSVKLAADGAKSAPKGPLIPGTSVPISEPISLFAKHYLPVTVGAGSLAGLGLSTLEETLNPGNKKLKDLKKSLAQIQKATQELKNEHNIQ